jgi:hypothetical protein
LAQLAPYLSKKPIRPEFPKVIYPDIRIGSDIDPVIFCSGDGTTLGYFFSKEYQVSTGNGSSRRMTVKKAWVKPYDLPGSLQQQPVGFLLCSSAVTPLKEVKQAMESPIQALFKRDHGEDEVINFALINRTNWDIPATAVGNNRFPLKDNSPVTVVTEPKYAKWLSTTLYRLLNKYEYRKIIPYRYNPNKAYSPSSKPDDHWNKLTNKHKAILAKMKVVYTSNINDLNAVYVEPGKDDVAPKHWTLKELVCGFYYPLLPPIGPDGAPCASDGKGNIKYDNRNNPIPAAYLVHEATYAHFSRNNSGEFVFTCLEDHVSYLQRIIGILPALCNYLIGGFNPAWFSPGFANKVLDEVTLVYEQDGTWTGDWNTKSDTELDGLIMEDIGFGETGLFMFEGMEQLTHQQEYTRPLDTMSIGTSQASADSLAGLLEYQESLNPPQQEVEAAPPPLQYTIMEAEVQVLQEHSQNTTAQSSDFGESDEDEEDNAMEEETPTQSSLRAGLIQQDAASSGDGWAGSLTQGAGEAV